MTKVEEWCLYRMYVVVKNFGKLLTVHSECGVIFSGNTMYCTIDCRIVKPMEKWKS
jgi:hypothetical protein